MIIFTTHLLCNSRKIIISVRRCGTVLVHAKAKQSKIINHNQYQKRLRNRNRIKESGIQFLDSELIPKQQNVNNKHKVPK